MRVDTLHKRISNDVRVMYDAVSSVLPAHMPASYGKRATNIYQFIDRLNRVCEPFSVHNDVQLDSTVREGCIVNSGLWIPDTQLPDNGSAADVRVIWHMNPKTRRVRMTHQWNRRRFYFFELLMHELIHRHQTTANSGRVARIYRPDADHDEDKTAQEYHGDCDEIETHAHDTALEMVTWWPDLTVRQAMQAAQELSGPVMPTYMLYVTTFSPSHPAMRHFKRKLGSWHATVRKHLDFYRSLELVKII